MANLDPMESFDEHLDRLDDHNLTFPWRLCISGGWMDLQWCNEIYPGPAITINVKHNPHFKDRCGLATSTRKVCIKLFNGARKIKHLTAIEAARFAWGAENMLSFKDVNPSRITREYRYIAGSQDHLGLFLPGINYLHYNASHWPKKIISLNDPIKYKDIYKYLESKLWLIEIPFEARPPGYSSQNPNYLKDPSIPYAKKRRMVKNLSDAAELTWKGIINKDASLIGKGFSGTMYAWKEMLPATVPDNEKLTKWWKEYERNSYGCLFSGAGGGFLMVISDKKVKNGFQIKINTDYYITKNTQQSELQSKL